MSIEAMKLALEALEEINKLSIGENAICLPAEIDTAMDALRQAIKQPEQAQPVAWVYVNTDGECEQIEYIKDEPIPDDPSVTALYTAPPQRQPLTDDALERMWDVDTTSPEDCRSLYYFKKVARSIEAAHGIGEKA